MLPKVDLGRIDREFSAAAQTKRLAKFYFDVFNYGERGEKIAGKKILNIGAGYSDFSFVVNTKNKGTVVDLDPKYDAKTPLNSHSNRIAGIVQDLPFADGAFDETIASYSLYWVQTGLDRALMEMLRVTKAGGAVKVHPIYFCALPSDIPSVHLDHSNASNNYTLTINKDPSISADRWQEIVRIIISSMSFNLSGKIQVKHNTDPIKSLLTEILDKNTKSNFPDFGGIIKESKLTQKEINNKYTT